MPTEPIEGIYIDRGQRRYEARYSPTLGWVLQRLSPFHGPQPPPVQRPDFASAVNAQIFIFQSPFQDA